MTCILQRSNPWCKYRAELAVLQTQRPLAPQHSSWQCKQAVIFHLYANNLFSFFFNSKLEIHLRLLKFLQKYHTLNLIIICYGLFWVYPINKWANTRKLLSTKGVDSLRENLFTDKLWWTGKCRKPEDTHQFIRHNVRYCPSSMCC